MMTMLPSELERPPFVLRRNFILTPFEKRFQDILQHARRDRSWHIIAAVPGSGKSLGIHDVVTHSGHGAPFKEVFAPPEILWRQFRRRLDTERPICTVLG